MQRWFSIPWIAFWWCTAIPSLSFSEEDLSAVIKYIRSSLVVVLPYDKNGEPLKPGNGFFINKEGDVVANIHVLQGASGAKIKTASGMTYAVTGVLAQDNEADLVLSSVDIPPRLVHPLVLSTNLPDKGEQVIVIDNPSEQGQAVSRGMVSGVREIPTFGVIVSIAAPFSPGRHCNPVLTLRGEVTGIVTFQSPEDKDMSFALHTGRVERLVSARNLSFNRWIEGEADAWFSSTEGLCNRGIFSLAAEDYQEAQYYFEKAVKTNPRHATANFLTGYCKDARGQYGEAIDAYKQAARVDPYLAEAHVGLGKVYGRLGRYAEAAESYRQVTRIQPESAEAHYKLGEVCGLLGRHAEAVKALRQAIRIKPEFAEAHLCLGRAYLGDGDKEQALEEYNILKDLDRDAADGLFHLIADNTLP